jgi:ABC-type lipoprotein release transport system permease subunit
VGSLDIAWKDIKRNKTRSILYIFTYSLAVSTSIALSLFSLVIVGYYDQESIHLNGSIIRAFYGHTEFLYYFSILMVIIESSLLASILTLARLKDLAILQSLGGTYKQIQRIPIAEIFIITQLGNLIGLVEGLIGGTIILLLLNLNISSFIVLKLIFSILLLFIISTIGSYIISSFFINYLLKKNFREIIESQFKISTLNSNKIWRFSLKNKLSFRLGYLLRKRSQAISFIMVFGVLVLTFLLSFGIFGGSIIQDSTDSYIKKGYGYSQNPSDVIVVTPSAVHSMYLEDLFNPEKALKFDLPSQFTSEYIPQSFLQQLQGTEKFDARLLMIGSIKMIGAFQIVAGRIVNIGNSTFKSYIWGIDSSFGDVFDYYSYSNELVKPSLEDIVIGDGYQLFIREKQIRSLIPKNINGYDLNVKRFEIGAEIIDPFAKGFCSFIDIRTLEELSTHLNGAEKNVVFIRDPSDLLLQTIEESGLHYFSLSPYMHSFLSYSGEFWFISNLSFIPILFALGLSFVAFSSLTTLLFRSDFYVLRILGGRISVLKRTILWLNILVGIQGMIPGIILGYSMASSSLRQFDIPPSILSWSIILLSVFLLFIFLDRYLASFTRRVIDQPKHQS